MQPPLIDIPALGAMLNHALAFGVAAAVGVRLGFIGEAIARFGQSRARRR